MVAGDVVLVRSGLLALPPQCECHQDRVRINMDAFVEKYQVSYVSLHCRMT